MGTGPVGGHNGSMSGTNYLNDQRVSDQQRDRAVDYLQQAYAAGGMEEEFFEERLGQALTAETRGELNRSLRGVARVAAPALARRPPVARPHSVENAQDRAQNVGAGLVHLSGLPTIFIGPAIVKAVATPGSRLWWEAGRAMSYQLTSMILGVSMIMLSLITGVGEGIVFSAYVLYVVLALVFSARAFNGQASTGRLAPFLPFRPEDPRRRGQLDR